jgi:hypothetical protein
MTDHEWLSAIDASNKALVAQTAATAARATAELRRTLAPLTAKPGAIARGRGLGAPPPLTKAAPARLPAPPPVRVGLLDNEAAVRKMQAAALVGTAFEDEAAARADRTRTEADALAMLKARLAGPGKISLEAYAQRAGVLGKSAGSAAAPPRVGTRVDSFDAGATVIAGAKLPPHAERRARLEAQRVELERRLSVEGRHPRLVEELQTNAIARKLLG